MADPPEDSILKDIKHQLGLAPDYDAFDPDVIQFINSVLATLYQFGIGPEAGFTITSDESKWQEFFGDDPRLNMVKSYVYLRVRLLFDPPTTSFLLEAFDKQIKEAEWRIIEQKENAPWPVPQS